MKARTIFNEWIDDGKRLTTEEITDLKSDWKDDYVKVLKKTSDETVA